MRTLGYSRLIVFIVPRGATVRRIVSIYAHGPSLGKIVKVFDHGDENLTRVFVCKKVSERKKETLILSVYKETNANTFVTHALSRHQFAPKRGQVNI